MAAGEEAQTLDHVGSTAVPGLAAKDVLDLQLGVADMAAADRLTIDWTVPPAGGGLLQAIFTLSEALARGWTPRQAEAVSLGLVPGIRPGQKSLGDALGISQQSTARLLADASYSALIAALAVVEE